MHRNAECYIIIIIIITIIIIIIIIMLLWLWPEIYLGMNPRAERHQSD